MLGVKAVPENIRIFQADLALSVFGSPNSRVVKARGGANGNCGYATRAASELKHEAKALTVGESIGNDTDSE